MAYISPISSSSLSTVSPLSSIKQESRKTFFDSSLEKSHHEASFFSIFSPPKLIAPQYLALMEQTESIARQDIHAASHEILYSEQEIKQHMEKKALALKEAAEKAKQQQVWSMLESIGTCILSSYNIAIGCSLTSTAPVLGSFVIAAGMLSAANLAMEKVDGWNLVAKHLAENNEELRQQILLYGPLAVSGLSFALTLGGLSSGGAASPCLESLEKALKIYTAGSIIGSGVFEAKAIHIQSHLSEIQGKIAQETYKKESTLSWIADMHSQVNHAWEEVKKTLQTSLQMRIQL